jgi:hypothetical protein
MAAVAVLGHHLPHDARHGDRHAGPHLFQGGRLRSAEVHSGPGGGVGVREGRPSREQVIEGATERVDVGADVHLVRVLHLLGGHVIDCAEIAARLRHGGGVRHEGEAHVEDLDLTLLRQE